MNQLVNGCSASTASAREPAGECLDLRVIEALEEYRAALEAGCPPDRQAFQARHPEIAAALAEGLAALEFVHAAAPQLSQPAAGPAAELPTGPADLHPGLTLGDYRILRPLGRGGMGVVYEAEQLSLGRRVALKVLPLAAALDARHLQRFQNEARAASQLHHTNIVPVYAVGCERGVSYYAMQYIDGQSLAAVIQELRQQRDQEKRDTETRRHGDKQTKAAREAAALNSGQQPVASVSVSPCLRVSLSSDVRTVANLGMQAAEALAQAHQQGVVHRDIKPANLLVDGHGHLWITDFGLAHLQGQPGLTLTGDLVGTPRYMSPEQALAKRAPVDQRADIYSLGATLYELLTLEPAFAGRDREELLQQIASEEPRPPRRLNEAIPADLETICVKAMAKEPERRYQTAGELAEDLRRFLAGQPILARPVGSVERLSRWCRRHPAPAVASGLAVVAFAAVVALSVGSVFAMQLSHEQDRTQAALQEADKQRARAEHQEKLGRHYLYAAHMTPAQRAWESDDIGLMRELLERHRPQRAEDEDLRGFEWHYLWRLAHPRSLLTLRGHTAAVVQMAYSPDGKRLVSRSLDGTVKEWDAATGQEIRAIKLKDYPQGRVWAEYSPDGKQFVAANRDGTMKVWDATTGQEIRTFKSPIAPRNLVSLALGPDGKWIALGNGDGTVALCDATTGQVVHTLKGDTAIAWHLAFSPDGQRLSSTSDQTLRVWDVTTGQELLALKGGHTDHVWHVAFSPDGKQLASQRPGGAVQVWDVTTGQEIHTLWGHGDIGARSGAFSSDGMRLVTNGSGGTIRLWNLDPGRDKGSSPLLHAYKGSTGVVLALAFSPDGKRLALGKGDGTVHVWDATTGPEEARTVALQGNSVAYCPDGKQLALGNRDGTVKVCDAITGQEVRTLKGHTGIVRRVAYSPEGSRLASSSSDQTVKLWDASTGQEIRTLKGHTGSVWCVAFSPDGQRLASGSMDRTVKIWDPTTGQELLTLKEHPGENGALAFSPDGKRLATSPRPERTIKIWDTTTGQEVLTMGHGHPGTLWVVAYSPDGKRLASASMSQILIWDTTTGQELLTLKGHTHRVRGVAFSPDGTRLASADLDLTLKIWDATPLPEKPPARPEPR